MCRPLAILQQAGISCQHFPYFVAHLVVIGFKPEMKLMTTRCAAQELSLFMLLPVICAQAQYNCKLKIWHHDQTAQLTRVHRFNAPAMHPGRFGLESVKLEEHAVYVLAGSQVQRSSVCQSKWAHD